MFCVPKTFSRTAKRKGRVHLNKTKKPYVRIRTCRRCETKFVCAENCEESWKYNHCLCYKCISVITCNQKDYKEIVTFT